MKRKFAKFTRKFLEPGQMSEIVQCSNQFSVRFPNRKSENFGIPKFSVPNGTSSIYRLGYSYVGEPNAHAYQSFIRQKLQSVVFRQLDHPDAGPYADEKYSAWRSGQLSESHVSSAYGIGNESFYQCPLPGFAWLVNQVC